jgi:hypothetical protein
VVFCSKCGSPVSDSHQTCQSCGSNLSSQPLVLAPSRPTAAVSVAAAPSGVLYHVSSPMSGQVSGPFNETAIQSLIAQHQIGINDSIAVHGTNTWIPITQSKFSYLVTQHTSVGRVAASTCPHCGAGMAVVIKRSGLGLALIIAGVVLTPVIVGVPIWIIGMIIRWGGKGTAAYRCPRCNFAT